MHNTPPLHIIHLSLTAFLVLICQPHLHAQIQPTAKSNKTSTTHDLIRHLLDQNLGTRKFPFPDVIFATTGKKVTPADATLPAHKTTLEAITQAANETIAKISAPDSPVRKLRRINEASRFFEDLLRKKITAHPDLTCTVPQNTQNRKQRSGYPDLLITHTSPNGTLSHFYLDPKLFEKKSYTSSLRTFYFEPRTQTNKIQHNACHLLLGISHDGKDGAWTFNSWHLCDLSKSHVRLKAEFQASNRDLYHPDTTIRTSNKP